MAPQPSLVSQGIAGMYRIGNCVFQLKETKWDIYQEMNEILTELDEKVDRSRVKEISVLLQTGQLLLEHLEAKSHDEKIPYIEDRFALQVKGLVDSANTYLTTVGVVAALLLGISIPWILTPLDQSSILLASCNQHIESECSRCFCCQHQRCHGAPYGHFCELEHARPNRLFRYVRLAQRRHFRPH